MRYRIFPLIAFAWMCAAPAVGAPAAAPVAPGADAVRTLRLVQAWVHGQYNNKTQFERDIQQKVPPGEIHRMMNQFFAPVTVKVPGLDGYLVYQHASADGTMNPRSLTRIGLLQYVKDPASGQLVQRELNFRNGEPWKNAHQNQEILKKATLADFNVNPGCDFYLSANAEGTEVSGTMKEKACTMWSDGLKMTLYAEDAIVIRPDEYRFWGRFLDASGTVRWGTQSRELYSLLRVSGP